MNNERITVQKCRTCLNNSSKIFPLTKPVRGCTPKKTYGQLLKEYAKFEYNADYERHMPQYLCFMCCRKLSNIYVFIQRAQKCHLELINIIAEQIDCLQEELVIDLPQLQEKVSVAIKRENPNSYADLEDQDSRNSIINEDNGNTLKQKLENDFQNKAETDKLNFSPEMEEKPPPASANSPLDGIQCLLCNELIDRQDNLKNHILIQHNVTDEAASFKYLLKQNRTSSTEQIFTCEKCSCKYNNNHEYLKHIEEQHNSKQSTNLENNIRKRNRANKVIKCQSCDYTAKSYAALNYHNRSKHGTEDDKLKCKFCSYTSFKKCNLLVHVKNVHKELVKTLKANAISNEEESSTTSTKNTLNNNFATTNELILDEENSLDTNEYSSDDDIPLAQTMKKTNITYSTQVEQDKEEFSDEDFIRNILNLKKRPRKMLSTKGLARRCNECGNIYKNYKSLCAHQRSVHISEDKFSLCPHCGKKYKRKGDLRIHIEKTHIPQKDIKTFKQQPTAKVREKRFMCTECSYTCTTITILNIHINRHHTGEKPHKCDICFKSFIVPYDLKVHRYLHTGEKPYKCPICLKGFRDNSHMLKHKRIHTNERPYKCNDCGKSFTQSYNLSVHKRTHLKEKKLNCCVCGKFFENKSMLNIHRINENHHDEVV